MAVLANRRTAAKHGRNVMSCLRIAAPVLIALIFAVPALAQKAADPMPPITGPPAPSPLQPGDAFGAAVTLPERTIIYLKGNGEWNNALETLQDAFKSVYALIEKLGLKKAGPPMTICGV